MLSADDDDDDDLHRTRGNDTTFVYTSIMFFKYIQYIPYRTTITIIRHSIRSRRSHYGTFIISIPNAVNGTTQ